MSQQPATPDATSPPTDRPPAPIHRPSYREITLSAVLFGIIVGVIMNAAITYAGLKIGFTITGSAIAAVLGFGVLRGILRRGSILETNIGQTIASAVNTSNSGIIFTVPVLLLMGIPLTIDSANFWLITLAGCAGAVLGTAFIIPLRKQMIDIDRLRFPSGTGVAVILKSPGAGPAKAVVLLVGLVIGATIYLPAGLHQLGGALDKKAQRDAAEAIAATGAAEEAAPIEISSQFGEALQAMSYESMADAVLGADQEIVTVETVDMGKALRLPPQFQLVFAIAPFALGAGFITGRPGLMVLAGGILAYFVLAPLAFAMGWLPGARTPDQAAGAAFVAFNRPLGIGLLLGGALMGVVASLPAIREALKGVVAASKVRSGGGAEELGLKPLAVAVVIAGVLLFIAAAAVSRSPVNTLDPVTQATISAEVSTAQLGGYAVGFESEETAATWESWSDQQRTEWLESEGARPGLLSGLGVYPRAAIIAIVGCLWIWFAGIIIAQCAGMTDWSPVSGLALVTVVLILLLAGTGAIIGAVMIGAALCVAITLASDMMQDLKSGHLIGGIPRRQQLAEIGVVWIGPIVAMLVLVVIAETNVKAGGPAMGPGAPNGAVAPQAQALQAVIESVRGGEAPYMLYGVGALLGALLGMGAFSGLGVLIGLSMYLPFHFIATYGIGCIVQMLVSKVKGRQWSEDWGVPMAAGLIVGESILALVVNLIVLSVG
jgi:uncharacterized oligopeptide transporter (OPT) family protein